MSSPTTFLLPMDLSALNPSQKEAVEARDRALLVRAGPGTGKTRVLAYRVARLVEQGEDPEGILAITFTNQAASEMAERLRSLAESTGLDLGRVRTMTFHGWAHSLLIGRDRALRLLSEPEQAIVMERLRRSFPFEETDGKGLDAKPPRASQIIAAISRLKQERDPDPVNLEPYSARLWGPYHRFCHRFGLVDYDDLMLMLADALSATSDDRPLGGIPPEWLPSHLLVDEFQDVSPVQYWIVLRLHELGASVTAIGDENQAIYGFRGATKSSMEDFLHDVPNARQIRLETAYRCPQKILDAAFAVVSQDSSSDKRSSRPSATTTPTIRSAKEIPGRIEIARFRSDREEARWIAATVEKLVGALGFDTIDSGLCDGHEQRSLSEVAVMFRFHRMAAPIRKALAERGIPMQSSERGSPLGQPEIHSLACMLELMRGTRAEDLVLELLCSRARRAVDRSVIEGLSRRFRRLCRDGLRHDGSRDVETFALEALEACGFKVPAGSMLAAQAAKVVSMALDDPQGRKGRCLALGLKEEQDILDISYEAVTLMTIHAAKGREFPIVFVAGMEEGVLPWDKGDLEEERRLLFVAMTRAAETLFLTRCDQRQTVGERLSPSPFLATVEPFCQKGGDHPLPNRKAKKGRRGRQKRLFG